MGERKTHLKICENYSNISRKIVSHYIKQCERCIEKMRKKEVSAGVVVKPILSTTFNQRVQIDLIDFQSLPDDGYKFIFHYQDHLSKYNLLRPLLSKKASEVADKLVQIFFDFGSPQILQSDNGREFTAQVIKV